MRTLVALALVCALGSLGCGDDDGATDAGTDTGGTDSGVDVGTGDTAVDANVETTTIRLRYLDAEDNPLENVKVRVDAAGGVVEATSGADGVVVLDVPAAVGEDATLTAALEGYTITTVYQRPLPVEVTSETPFDVVLFPVSADPAPMFTIDATGVPAGGRICVSFDGWAICDDPPETAWAFQVPPANIGEFANIWLLDDTDTAIDFERVAVPDGATSLDVTFDGTFETEPTVRTVTIEIPADGGEMLTFETDTLVRLWQGWFALADVETAQMWSVATKLTRDGDDLTVEVAELVPPGDVTARYGSRVFSNIQNFTSSNYAVYVEDPGTTASTLGLATLSGDQLTQPFAITPPAALGAEPMGHVVNFRNSAQRFVWQVQTFDTDFEMPPLPTGYDPTVSFPFEGSSGTAIVRTFTETELGSMAPFAFDIYGSDSAAFPVTY